MISLFNTIRVLKCPLLFLVEMLFLNSMFQLSTFSKKISKHCKTKTRLSGLFLNISSLGKIRWIHISLHMFALLPPPVLSKTKSFGVAFLAIICLTEIFCFCLSLSDKIIHDMHTSLLSGHEGISRTNERLLQNYFWPNMEAKISQHVAACLRYQARHTTDKPKPPLLMSMPQCTSLNQRVACDLMGPLRTSSQGKHYVLCLTDAFTKYAEITALTDKSAPTVARAI